MLRHAAPLLALVLPLLPLLGPAAAAAAAAAGLKQCAPVDPAARALSCVDQRLNDTRELAAPSVAGRVLVLNLSINFIQVLELQAFGNVRVLDLKYNSLKGLDADALRHLVHLEEADFAYNAMKVLHVDAFVHNPNLKRVSLHGNIFRSLGSKPILSSRSLRSLDLGWCSLNRVSTATFSELPALEELDIGDNDIRELTRGSFALLTRLRRINILENRFACDCRLDDLLQWTRRKYEYMHSASETWCYQQPATKKVWSVEKASLNCSEEYVDDGDGGDGGVRYLSGEEEERLEPSLRAFASRYDLLLALAALSAALLAVSVVVVVLYAKHRTVAYARFDVDTPRTFHCPLPHEPHKLQRI